LANLIPNLQAFAEASGSGAYVFDIIKRESKIDASRSTGDIPSTFTGDIEFKNIHFTYPSRQESSVRKFNLLFRVILFFSL
jgi:ABC-type multidrug transport system fused ATPase/permease subunit